MDAVAPLALHLGCCASGPRCLLCTPQEQVDSPEVAAVLLADHAGPVHTFGGAPPDDALMRAIGDRSLRVRVRPDLLDRQRAKQLVDRGALRIELDCLTTSDRLLKWSRRTYRASRILEMADTLAGWDVQVGVVQAVGLHGSHREDVLHDAKVLSRVAHTVRLHPVLVLRGSHLADRWAAGGYRPLDVENAAALCEQAMRTYEAAGVTVLRVGQQAGPDGLGTVVAGPVHPSLREHIEMARTHERLRSLLRGTPGGGHLVISCAPADLARTKGPSNRTVRALRHEFYLAHLDIEPDPTLQRGHNRVRRAP